MEEPQDIFAELLSGLQPTTARANEPTEEVVLSMEETRRKALSDSEPSSVAVRRSDSPVGDNLKPPPPPITKDEMVELVRENVRSLLFQSFGALTTSLRTALNGVTERVDKVEELQLELSHKVETVMQKQSAQGEAFTESFRHIEATLKEASVGIQRMLEKQDLVDAHVLLNRHAREQHEEKNREPVEDVKKSEKRVTLQKEEALEEASEEEEEEENPPIRKTAPKRAPQAKQRPVNYNPEPEVVVKRPVERVEYVEEEREQMKQPAPVYHPPPAQMQRQTPHVPQTYPMEGRPPMPQQPAPRPLMPQPQPPQQQPLLQPQPPQQQPLLQPQPPQQQPLPQPPAPRPPMAQPQQMAPQYAPQGGQQLPPQAPPYGYPPQGQVAENGGYPAPPPPAVEKTPALPMPYLPQMPPGSSQFAPPPPPSSIQQPPPPMQPSLPPQQPPSGYTGYPSLPPQQAYRPVQPPPPPPQQAVYGSPASLQASKPPPRRSNEPAHASPQSIPLDQVINDVANMGFDRTKVRSVVTNMLDHGEAVDLNVVIDRLTNMGY